MHFPPPVYSAEKCDEWKEVDSPQALTSFSKKSNSPLGSSSVLRVGLRSRIRCGNRLRGRLPLSRESVGPKSGFWSASSAVEGAEGRES